MRTNSIVNQVKRVARKWKTDLGLPFQAVLPAMTVMVAVAAEKISFRERFFSPGGHAVGVSLAGLE